MKGIRLASSIYQEYKVFNFSIDDMTPLYKIVLDEMPYHARRVLVSLALFGLTGANPSNLMKQARMRDRAETSHYLNVLHKWKFVEHMENKLWRIPDKKLINHILVRSFGCRENDIDNMINDTINRYRKSKELYVK